MKRVQDLIVSSISVAAGVDTGGELDAAMTLANFGSATEGDVNIIDPATGIAWATGGDSAVVIRACADSDGNPFVRQSLPLIKGQIRSYTHKEYAEATPKKMTLDLSGLPANAAQGDIHELWITDYKDSNFIIPRRRISFVATATLKTPTQVAAGLAAQILDDVSMPNVTATSAGDVLTVIGAAVDGSGNIINDFRASHEILFNIGLGEGVAAGVLLTTVPAFKGCGTYREVRKLEEIYKGYRGYTNRVIYPSSSNIMHDQPFHTNNEGAVPSQVSTVISMDSSLITGGDAFKTAMDLVMAELF